jgi:hypothetical protein
MQQLALIDWRHTFHGIANSVSPINGRGRPSRFASKNWVNESTGGFFDAMSKSWTCDEAGGSAVWPRFSCGSGFADWFRRPRFVGALPTTPEQVTSKLNLCVCAAGGKRPV